MTHRWLVATLLGLGLVVLVGVAGCPRPSQPPAATPAPGSASEVIPTAAFRPERPTLRLPRNFTPTAYTARLAIDPARTDFAGSIVIAGTVDRRSASLWLHGHKLAIDQAVARSSADDAEVPIQVTAHGDELLELVPARPLDPGSWSLQLDYRGVLDTVSTTGAFRQTVGGASYVYTQLEALYARRVFPCIDEPDIKVPWALTLDVPSTLVAVSNTAVAHEQEVAPGTRRVAFATTKPLPSYLIAFGVGPFEFVDGGRSTHGTPVRVVTLAGRTAEAAHAAKTTARLLDLAEAWFGTPYPYDKLDMLVVPLTVGFGAMENAGLVTFTETLILHGPKASQQRLRRWAVVAAHEIAHQWFGNLVTMRYWDDIWLNEGFANWVESKIAAQFEPAWRELEAELDTRNGALEADAVVSARQIRQPIASNDDILNAFDGITYDKGSSVLAMFERYVGADVFQRGVRAYLAERAWGNATSEDLAAALAHAAGDKRLVAAFASFLDQPGAPELTVTTVCDGPATITISQRRYVPPGAPVVAAAQPWIVPVCVAYDRDGQRAEACTLLDGPSTTLALQTPSCPRWLMPNVDGRGYYRATYEPHQLAALHAHGWAHLTWTERRAVWFDVSETAAVGRLPLAAARSLIPAMLAGGDRFTVPTVVGFVTGLSELVPEDLRGAYERWLRQTFGAQARALGWQPRPKDGLDAEHLRTALVGSMARTARDPALVKAAVTLAARWRDLPQSIRGLVLLVAVDANAKVFERVLTGVATEPDRARRQEMYDALRSVRDPARQRRVLDKVLDPALDLRETLNVVYGGSTEATRRNARQFVAQHLDAILARLPRDSTTSSVADLSWVFTTACVADERDAIAAYVTTTFAGYPGGARVVAQHIEAMDQCIARRALLVPELRTWLAPQRAP